MCRTFRIGVFWTRFVSYWNMHVYMQIKKNNPHLYKNMNVNFTIICQPFWGVSFAVTPFRNSPLSSKELWKAQVGYNSTFRSVCCDHVFRQIVNPIGPYRNPGADDGINLTVRLTVNVCVCSPFLQLMSLHTLHVNSITIITNHHCSKSRHVNVSKYHTWQ